MPWAYEFFLMKIYNEVYNEQIKNIEYNLRLIPRIK